MLIYDNIECSYYEVIPVKKIEEKIKDINEKLIFATMQANIKDMEKYAYQQMICNELIKENTESED